MKAWQKGAIIGGLWGLASYILLLFLALGKMSDSYTPVEISTLEKIIGAPILIFMYLDYYHDIKLYLPIIYWTQPFILGGLLLGGLGYLYDRWKEK